jgi:hypothetical protein
MPFPTNSVIDNFNRSNEGPPMTGWANIVSGLVVSSNVCAPSGSGNRSGYHATILSTEDCEVYATIGTAPANNRNMTLLARLHDISGSSVDGYGLRLNKVSGTDTLQIVRVDGGVLTNLGSAISQELAAGNKFGLEIVGDTLTAYVDTGSGWTAVGSTTDATYDVAGYLGIDIGGSGTLDDFGGGELSGTPDPILVTAWRGHGRTHGRFPHSRAGRHYLRPRPRPAGAVWREPYGRFRRHRYHAGRGGG